MLITLGIFAEISPEEDLASIAQAEAVVAEEVAVSVSTPVVALAVEEAVEVGLDSEIIPHRINQEELEEDSALDREGTTMRHPPAEAAAASASTQERRMRVDGVVAEVADNGTTGINRDKGKGKAPFTRTRSSFLCTSD